MATTAKCSVAQSRKFAVHVVLTLTAVLQFASVARMSTNALHWLFGDLFEQRVLVEKGNRTVLWSKLARSLMNKEPPFACWEELTAQYAALLINPEDAPAKLRRDITTETHDFDNKLMETFVEVRAVVHLAALGRSRFQALIPPTERDKRPDFLFTTEGGEAALEVKNLRVHRHAEDLMLRLHEDEQLKEEPTSEYVLVVLRSARESLGREDQSGEQEIRTLLRQAAKFERQVVHERWLTSRVSVRFRIEDLGESRVEDDVSLEDLQSEAITKPMLKKILRVAKDEAVPQLFSAAVEHVKFRFLAFRWDLPHYEIMRSASLSTVLETAFEELYLEIGKRFGVLVFSDYGIEWDALRLVKPRLHTSTNDDMSA